jgi:hypothetical protein
LLDRCGDLCPGGTSQQVVTNGNINMLVGKNLKCFFG